MKLPQKSKVVVNNKVIAITYSEFEVGATNVFSVITPNLSKKTVKTVFIDNGDGTGSWVRV